MTTATTTIVLDEREANRPRQFWNHRPNHSQLWSFPPDTWRPILVQGTRTRRRSRLAASNRTINTRHATTARP